MDIYPFIYPGYYILEYISFLQVCIRYYNTKQYQVLQEYCLTGDENCKLLDILQSSWGTILHKSDPPPFFAVPCVHKSPAKSGAKKRAKETPHITCREWCTHSAK